MHSAARTPNLASPTRPTLYPSARGGANLNIATPAPSALGHHGTVFEPMIAGKLLISSPSMSDLNFDRTVVFLLEHHEEGALGLVLNRPAPIELAEALPLWAPLAADPPVLFVGGPVSPGGALALARAGSDLPIEGFTPVLGAVGLLDLAGDPTELSTHIDALRLFSGYSGWGPGQLDREVSGGAWFVIDAEPDDPFTPTPDGLWAAALKREQGVEAVREQDPKRHWLN